MAAPLRLSWSHRQHRLAAVERLDLALFIDAQDQRTLGRRQVEPDNVAHLLDEQGISRELEALRTVRLKAKGFPDAMDGRRRVVDGFSHRPQATMRSAPRSRLPGQPDQIGRAAWRERGGES